MPVVDASIVVDWVAPDADPHGRAGRLLHRFAETDQSIAAPRLLFEEVANALLTGCRRRRWDGTAADQSYALLRRLPVAILDDFRDLDRAWDLSRRYDEHPVYALVYVALAERLGEQFFTADESLRRRLFGLNFVVGP